MSSAVQAIRRSPPPLSGLLGGTTYHYRLVVTNANGKAKGRDMAFTTVSAVKDTLALPASNLTTDLGDPERLVRRRRVRNQLLVRMGRRLQRVYPNKVPLPAPPGQNEGTPVGTLEVHQNISGLTKNTTYHYRLVAKNSLGETKSDRRILHHCRQCQGA